MTLLQTITLSTYSIALTFIFIYSMVQLHLVILYRRADKKKENQPKLPKVNPEDLPIVTIQLPVYNELYVIERLIDTVANLDYPKEKLEIQMLDDSNDETVEVIAKKVKEWQEKGIDIQHIQRPQRTGFKAGALDYGQKIAKGEFIAIFDADFIPQKDFLLQTVPFFENPETGVVQTRWGHINEDYSLLTRLQAFGLNAHFIIEQTGRSSGGHFLNFNGTAGIWRKKCIEDAGGWQHDTLTEDLDLSYRAQLKNWKIKYLEKVISPAELPVEMNALKSQQYRWNKGAAEVMRKHFKLIFTSKIPFSSKIHAVFHLMNSSIFVFVVLCAFLSIPMLFIKNEIAALAPFFKVSSLFLLSLGSIIIFYWNALRKEKKTAWETTKTFIPRFFMFLSMSMGLSIHNAIAVLEGYMGRQTPFVRTPKFNLTSKKGDWKSNKYFTPKLDIVTLLEGLATGYFIYGMYVAYQLNDFGLFPFHLMLTMGFGAIFYYSLFHFRK